MPVGLITYMDSVRREDLLDLLSDVSPDDTPLVTMFTTTTAKGTYHEWTEDYQGRPTSNSFAPESQTTTYTDLTQPARRGNFTHIITKPVRVSGTELAVNVAGMGDPFTYQKAKGLRAWKSQLEYNVLNGTVGASGASAVARQTIGITAVITSHTTARNSGTSLTEDMFNEAQQVVWNDVGNDNMPDLILVNGGLKRKISSFTAGNTKNVDASDKRLTRPVSVYEGDFNTLRIIAHRDVINSAGTVHMIGLREDKWALAYLRQPTFEDRPKDGDYKSGEWIGEQTLEFRAEKTSFKQTGFALNG